MGREIRRVPKDWKHPEKQPMYDSSYRVAMEEWNEEKRIFDAIGPSMEIGVEGKRDPKDVVEFEGKHYLTFPDDKSDTFEEWHGGPPNEDYYRPDWKPEEMTHYQIYETVSEGSPIGPVFASLDQCEDYLVNVGDHWGKYTREQARLFCKRGWAPSMTTSINVPGVIPGIVGMAETDPDK